MALAVLAGRVVRRAAAAAAAPGPMRGFASVPSVQTAAVVRQTGAADALVVEHDFPVPPLGANQVLVRNRYAGINFIDTYHRKGLYHRDLPFVGGQEGGGEIAALSPEAEAAGYKVGDRVAYSILGTYCQYSAVPVAKLLPVPDGVGIDTAVCCPVQGLTAHYLTTDAHAGLVQPGEWMLIHGTGGGTCQWAAQMAKIMGYKVIGTVSKSKESLARATGVDELIVLDDAPGASFEDYTSVDVAKRVMEITDGAGVKAVIDGIGLATWEISLNSLGRRGIFVSFGNASGTVPAFEPLKLIGKSLFMTRPKLLDYVADRPSLLKRSGDVFGWIRDGKLNVSVDRAFPLADAAEGHKYLESGASTGKVLYEIP